MSLNFGRSTGRRILAVESLERRMMLAGDVDVKVAGGNLKIRGDAECNGVLIVQLRDREYAVIGFDHDGAPTTINGRNEPFIARGVKNNFLINLRKGDDLLGIGNDVDLLADLAAELGFGGCFCTGGLDIPDLQLRVPKSLIVHTEDGEDGVVMNADVRYDMIVDTGKHSDGIAVAQSNIGDDMILHTQQGQDGVLIEDANIRDFLLVHTGHDGDSLLAIGTSAGHALLISGQGSDSVAVSEGQFDRELTVLTEQGDDEVLVSLTAAKRMHLDTSGGNDTVAIVGIELDRDLTLHTGSGKDEVEIAEAQLRKLFAFLGNDNDDLRLEQVKARDLAHLDTGSGNDKVTIAESSTDNLMAFLGSGNDALTVTGSKAKKALLRGGSGFDTLNVDSRSFARKVDEDQFEDVNVIV